MTSVEGMTFNQVVVGLIPLNGDLDLRCKHAFFPSRHRLRMSSEAYDIPSNYYNPSISSYLIILSHLISFDRASYGSTGRDLESKKKKEY